MWSASWYAAEIASGSAEAEAIAARMSALVNDAFGLLGTLTS
jgi:hypothetical protein